MKTTTKNASPAAKSTKFKMKSLLIRDKALLKELGVKRASLWNNEITVRINTLEKGHAEMSLLVRLVSTPSDEQGGPILNPIAFEAHGLDEAFETLGKRVTQQLKEQQEIADAHLKEVMSEMIDDIEIFGDGKTLNLRTDFGNKTPLKIVLSRLQNAKAVAALNPTIFKYTSGPWPKITLLKKPRPTLKKVKTT